jgi:hypothetical protein
VNRDPLDPAFGIFIGCVLGGDDVTAQNADYGATDA